MRVTLQPRFYVLLIFAILLGLMAGLKVFTIHSSFMDLGVFEWNFWNITFNNEWQRAFCGHVQPLMLFAALGYKLFPSAYFLIIVQSFLLASPLLIIPYIINNSTNVINKTDEKSASQLGMRLIFICPLVAYILYFPVWYNALFDFHMDHIAVPLGFLFYLSCVKERWGWAVLSGAALSFVKEPFALMTSACGVYIICRQFPIYRQLKGNAVNKKIKANIPCLAGGFLIIFGIVYFYFAVNIVSPVFTNGSRTGIDSSAYSWLGANMADMVKFIVFHPWTIISEIITTPKKLIYLSAVFGSLAFIPLLAPLELIPALPVLAISMLSRMDNYYGLGNHYTAGLIAPLIVAFIVGLPRAVSLFEKIGLSKRFFYIFLAGIMLLANIMISPSPVSRLFLTNKIWSYGYAAYIPDKRTYMIRRAIKQYIPSDPKAAVSVQNDLNMSYLTKRDVCLPFPVAVFQPHMLPDWRHPREHKYVLADYVVLDLKRPLFLIDKGCDWQYGRCRDGKFVEQFMDTLEKTRQLFLLVYQNDGFMILKRKDLKTGYKNTDKNAE